MKQRLTYLLPANSNLVPSDLSVKADRLDFAKAPQAHEEWRVTLGLHELPDELKLLLAGCQELHLRWSSRRPHVLTPPLVSRLPAGLHVFMTPSGAGDDLPICDLLKKLVGDETKCTSVHDSFARLPAVSESLAQPATFQWYQNSSIRKGGLAEVFLGKVCPPSSAESDWGQACDSLIRTLDDASHVDVDFDAGGQTLSFTAYWSAEGDGVSREASGRLYRKAGPEGRLEVGVLQAEEAKDSGELSLGGYLTVIGEDERPSATLFSFPSRHHPLPPTSASATFKTTIQHPSGLHPKLHLRFPRQLLTQPPQDTCTLHTYLTLPSTLFIDRFQLSDRLFLDSQNLVSLQSLIGEDDLEAPNWVISRWGSAALIELAASGAAVDGEGEMWTAAIPLHLRYLSPLLSDVGKDSTASVQVPWPIVFWACEVEDAELNLDNNPFDRVDLGFDGLFTPQTLFYHVPPARDAMRLVEEIQVPVLRADSAGWVQMGTFLAVVVGFAWICWQLARAVDSGKGKGKKKR